jgi:pimeloyl-ACP methyl ester carboxylesterase
MAYERLPNGELKILKNCSHLPFYEDPQAYEEAVASFLSKCSNER